MKLITKENIRIRIIALSVVYVSWIICTFLSWDSGSKFSILVVLGMLVLSTLHTYFDWKKYKAQTT